MTNEYRNSIYNLSTRELQTIERHVAAFNYNFGSLSILKLNGSYIINQGSHTKETIQDNYKYRAGSIDELNGWLYGCVQTTCGQVRKVD